MFNQVLDKYKASSQHVSPLKDSKLLPEFTSSRKLVLDK